MSIPDERPPVFRTRQRRVSRAPWQQLVLLTILVAGVGLLVYSVIRGSDAKRKSWVEILDASDAVVVTTTAAVTYTARDQFVKLTKPYLFMRSRLVATARRLPKGDGPFWQVLVSNTGQGVLEIESVRYHYAVTGGGPWSSTDDVQELHAALRKLGLVDGTDYWHVNFSAGATIGPSRELDYFECRPSVLKAVSMLDATIQFSSSVGDRYEKSLHLLPGKDASQSVLAESDGEEQ